MHRIVWLRIGGTKIHLLKLTGALLIAGALLKTFESAYQIFVTASKASVAQARPDLVPQFFGWAIDPQYGFTMQDVVGVMMGPLANFVFWLGAATIALMIYQSGKTIFPIEEIDQQIREHHQNLIRKAVEHHKSLKKK